MHAAEMLHCARTAMLQAAVAAYLNDVEALGADTFTLSVTRDMQGAVLIEAEHLLAGQPVEGYSL